MKTYHPTHLVFSALIMLGALEMIQIAFPGLDPMGFYIGIAMIQGLISGLYLDRYLLSQKREHTTVSSAS